MTDEQFDEICRSALAFEPGTANGATWSRIRPPRWNWLPTVPEILACGCACGLVLFVFGVRLSWGQGHPADANPVVQRALRGSLAGLEASALQFPDATQWTEASLSLPAAPGVFQREAR
jgi:hypothetical protein